ncbi:unnamed protein product [Closterium sp. Naga37s-1]|nr:unnamed protein product [Closterium sp. Naga37s-1]
MGILRSFVATPLAMSLVLVLIVQLLSVRVATGYTHTSFHRHHRDGGRVGFNRITEARAAGDVEDTWDVLAGTPLPPGIGRLHREAREDAGEEGEDEVGEEWETGGEEEGEDDGGVEGEEEGKQGTVISHALEKKIFARGQLSEDSGRGREWGGYNRVHRQVGRWHAGKPRSGDFIKVGGSENTIDGVKVIGGVCYDNWDGLKVNNGKFNRLKHVLVVNALKAPGWYGTAQLRSAVTQESMR